MNLLANVLSEGLGKLQWLNPTRWEPLPDGGLRVLARPRTDFFQNPDGSPGNDSAHFLWLAVQGDFVARAHVRPNWEGMYDAGALMVRADETHWAKLCYEATDLGTHAVVSVVTDGLSDDANGPNLEAPKVRLQIVRQGNLFAMHYALPGEPWQMVRYFSLFLPSLVQVGLVAQSPVGRGATADFAWFSVEARRLENVRAGT